MDSVGEGEGGKIGENGIETYTIMYKTSRQSRFDAQYWRLGAGHGMEREEGGGFRMGNTSIPVADSF